MTPTILLILDGWGESSAWAGNALNHFNTPNFHQLIRSCFHTSLTALPEKASDRAVNNPALPYSIIGAGRLQAEVGDQLSQFFGRDRQFNHQGFNQIFQNVSGNLHIIGFLDAAGVHCRPDHLAALAKAAFRHQVKEVYFHLGVESDPALGKKAFSQAQALNQELAVWGGAHVVSLFGSRSVLGSQGRSKNLKKILILLTRGDSWHYQGSLSFLFEKYYSRGFEDRNFPPSCLKVKNQPAGRIKSGDTVIIAALTPASGRPLVKILANPELLGLPRLNLNLLSLTDYGLKTKVKPIFPFQPSPGGLAETLSRFKKNVFKLGPEERRFELGYYFNGGWSEEFPGEKRRFYQPLKVSRDILLGADRAMNQFYDQLKKNRFDLGILSLPNADVLARSADVEELEEGVRALDDLIGQLAEKVSNQGASLIITAPFGNAESIIDPATGEKDPAPTRNLVPFILVNPAGKPLPATSLALEGAILNLGETNTLADVAPTILNLMGIPKPLEMTGQSLVGRV